MSFVAAVGVCAGRGAALVLVAGLALGGCASKYAQNNQPPPPSGTVSSDTLIKLAEQARDAGDLATAAGFYQRAHEMDPRNIQPLLQLGGIWSRMHQPRPAADAWQAALAIDPSNTTALRGLANAKIQSGDPAGAIAPLQTAARLQPDWRVQNSLGVANDMLADHAAAQAAYRAGLGLAPGNLELTSNLGLSLALAGDFGQSLPLLEQAARDPSATPRQRQNLALAYGLSGDDPKAAQVLKVDLDPGKVQANLGYYEYLRLLHDRKAIAAAIGAHEAQ
jgi:Flp pilus assembly protein TadD